MLADEGVHVVDQDLHGRLLHDRAPVVFVDGVLQQQDEDDQDLLESPGAFL